VLDRDGAIETVAALDIRDGRVAAIYAVRNPDKLAHISLGAIRGATLKA
jgi:RNA polymerase sigma-70 factor (ECF subfamily)